MKKIIFLFVIICAISVNLFGKTKTIEKSFPTSSNQLIELNNFSGSNMKIYSWDKNEVYIKIKVNVSSSDDEWEDIYLKEFNIDEDRSNSTLTLRLKETDEESGTSIFGIKIKAFNYQKVEKSGEIYVPQNNSLKSDFKYGTISLKDIKGKIELNGSSNSLELNNCKNIEVIENNYGTTKMYKCGGNLNLKGSSSTVTIKEFAGSAFVDANYSTIILGEIKKSVEVKSTSANIKASNIEGDFKTKANYSTIDVNDITGYVDIGSTSASIYVKSADGVSVNSNYSTISVSDIKGKNHKSITLNGKSGTITLEDAVGNVKIDNDYGSVQMNNVKGDVEISNSSGSINAKKITGDWISNTRYSEVSVSELSAKSIRMQNRSNGVYLDLKTTPSNVDIKNEYGGIHIDMPSGFSGDINAEVAYGDIDTNFPVKVKKLGSSAYAVSKVGNGSGRINLETKSANIELYEK
ncbi:MAG: hypothetical protein C4539_03350 [Ignavibacteriales bacterium]|nr:MAG: hypothetical protein C4539_03350 [Ignavibacteriales bacterium]